MNSKIAILLFLNLSLQSYSQTRTSLECLEREFNVTVHIVTDSDFNPSASLVGINSAIAALNTAWKPICVKFNLCEVRIDSNYNFIDWHKDDMEAEYLALNYEPRRINIIVVRYIEVPVGAAGYADLGGISSRGPSKIVVAGANPLTWIHEMGHYFGLKHTFETPIAKADNSDCSTKDDGVCDTPPDPDPSGTSHSNCIYIGAFQDGTGKYYNPLTENYMSYYGACRKSFTHMQYERMVTTYKIDTEAKF